MLGGIWLAVLWLAWNPSSDLEIIRPLHSTGKAKTRPQTRKNCLEKARAASTRTKTDGWAGH